MNVQQHGAVDAAPYDYRACDQIWQRVAPSLNPYPGAAAVPASAPVPPETPAPVPPEESLPGAQENPCCMGSAAAEMLKVLAGFIEDELSDQRYYQAFARQAPAWARSALREIGEDEGGHARRLTAVYYLITGQCYRPSLSCERIYVGRFCAALRERYHAEACGGFNYIRASENTTDPCLTKILAELSADEYRHAEILSGLLERAITAAMGCGCGL